MVRHLGLLLAVSACNQLLDLEAPERTEADTDGDGVVDSRDLCPQIANPDQVDTDRDRRGDACDECPTSPPTRDRDQDGVDDACDSCVRGPQIDDDGDGVMDACDLCPVTFGVIQFDIDGDLVGDACDQRGDRDDERVLFDPFTALGPDWSGTDDWELGADGSSVTPIMAAPVASLGRDDLAASVSVAFVSAAESSLTVRSGEQTSCEVRCTQGTCAVFAISEMSTRQQPIPAARGTLNVSVRPPGFVGMSFLECGVYIDGLAPVTASSQTDADLERMSVTITATVGTRVLGVDLIR